MYENLALKRHGLKKIARDIQKLSITDQDLLLTETA